MRVDEKIALDAFRPDAEPHIRIRQERCRACVDRICQRVCPGGLYSRAEATGEMLVEHAGCLECGSCLTSCPLGALEWRYPQAGCGVRYRYG
jgi:ferredoxin like protein